LLFVKFQNYIL